VTRRGVRLLTLPLALTVTACGELDRGFHPAVDTDTIVYNMDSQPTSIDPARTTELISGALIQHVFEGLTATGANMEILPGVAERWDISEDGLTYDFHLRDDAEWSDGRPVTAHDFAYAWERVLTPETGAQYANLFWVIEGAEEFNTHDPDESEGPPPDISSVGFEVVDDHHLRVRLTRPVSYFLQLAAFMTFAPVRQDVIEEHGDAWTLRAETYIGNGAFTVTEYERDFMMRMRRNDTFWNRDAVEIENLVWYIIGDQLTEYIAYLTDSIDVTYGLPYANVPEIKERISEHLRVLPMAGTYFVGFNFRREPFDNPLVRRALGLAVDRERISEEVFERLRGPAFSWVPPGIPDADGATDFSDVTGGMLPNADVEAAREALAQAGYPNGEGFPEVTYAYNTHDDHRKIAERLQATWKRVLNIDIGLENQEWQVFHARRREGAFQFHRGGWIGDYVDPMTFLHIYLSYDGNNTLGYANSRYDSLVEAAQQTADREEYFRLCHEAEAVLIGEDMANIPIYHYAQEFLVNPALEGINVTPMGIVLFHSARWSVERLREEGVEVAG
jgi:oligopeptide transport system substrate-binding protein